MLPLAGRVAVVTGASMPSGIGRSIAHRFAAAGADLFLVAEGSAADLEAACGECRSRAASIRVEYGIYDLSEALSAERMIEDTVARFGRIDILVNNAATRVAKDLGDYTREDFERVVGVNLAAPFFACQAAIPWMKKQGGGRIINIASQLAKVAVPQRALYGMTKAGLVHLTKSLALELGRDGIVVNSISPGPVATQRVIERMDADPEARRALEASVPLGRCGHPDEIADVALFLASTSPSYLQGQDICIDGGYTLR